MATGVISVGLNLTAHRELSVPLRAFGFFTVIARYERPCANDALRVPAHGPDPGVRTAFRLWKPLAAAGSWR